jgi:DNA-binding PadR family transcriptional regulator
MFGFLPYKSSSMFIRDYLLSHGEGYIHEIYRAFREWLKAENYVKLPSYQSFRTYFWRLRRLGLIEFVRDEPSGNPFLKAPRKYYRIVPGKENDEGWINPFRSIYLETYLKHHRVLALRPWESGV